MIRSTSLLVALTALERMARMGSIVLGPSRPVAGGVVITPTPGGPTPVVTPIVGGAVDPNVGGQILGPDLSGVALVFIIAAALIGFSRGVRRELVSVAVIAASYVIFDRLWGLVTTYGNRLWRLFRFAIVERGVLAEDPTVAWQAVSGTDPLLPLAAGAALWQLGLFVMTILVFGYGGARVITGGPHSVKTFSHLPKVLERVVGAVLGAVAGSMIGHFVLPRIVPNAYISLIGPRSAISEHIGEYGPAILFAIIVILILYGVSGIGGSGPKQQVFN